MSLTKLYYLIVLTASLIISGCAAKENHEEEAKESESKASNTVILSRQSIKDIRLETVPAGETEISGRLSIPAKIQADQDYEAIVGANLEGRVQKVLAKLGDHVQKGQVLMLIEGAGIGEIKAEYIKSRAEFAFAESSLKRQKQLLEQKAGSQKSYFEAEAAYNKALASFNAEDKRLHSIGLSESDVEQMTSSPDHLGGVLRVKAPISGVIVERNVVTGQQVDPSTNAFRIINSASVMADGQIYEKDIQYVTGKQNVILTVSSYPGKQFTGRITYIGEVMDSETRTVKVRAAISNTGHLLKPEMFAEMSVSMPKGVRGITVPEEAVIRENGSNFVFVAKNDTTFEKRLVETGSVVNNYTHIIKGLQKGETVVSKGTFYLKSEMLKGMLEEEE
ncbi:MAG: efflux RND transporter periplasmic adaptor subunit [Bacteroidota bacterium]